MLRNACVSGSICRWQHITARKTMRHSRGLFLLLAAAGLTALRTATDTAPARRADREKTKSGNAAGGEAHSSDTASRSAGEQQLSWIEAIDRARGLTVSFVAFAVMVLILIVIGKATFQKYIIVEKIMVPKEFAELGYTEEFVTRRFVDNLGTLARRMKLVTGKERSILLGTPTDASIKLEIPGSGMSLFAIVYYLRDLVGVSDTKVSGEIIQTSAALTDGNNGGPGNKPGYAIYLRVGGTSLASKANGGVTDIDDMLRPSVIRLLEVLDPNAAGYVHLRNKNWNDAMRMAAVAFAMDERSSRNLRGLIAQQRGNRAQAGC